MVVPTGAWVSGGFSDPANASGADGDVQHQGAVDGLGEGNEVAAALQHAA